MGPTESTIEAINLVASGQMCGHPRKAWELMETIWPVLQRFILRRLRYKGLHINLLEDCGQIVVERVWKYRSTYKGSTEGEFWAWLRMICDNECIRMAKKEEKQPIRQTDLDALSNVEDKNSFEISDLKRSVNPTAGTKASGPEIHEIINVLMKCLEILKEKQRSVIELLFFKAELPERAAAEVMGCSPAYIHKMKAQAIESLRRCLISMGVDS